MRTLAITLVAHRLAELRRVATAITGCREHGLDPVHDGFALGSTSADAFFEIGMLNAHGHRLKGSHILVPPPILRR